MGQSFLIGLLGLAVLAVIAWSIGSMMNKPSRKLLHLTRRMSEAEINNDKANQLIGLLMSIKLMPRKTAYWDSIKRGYRLVEQSGNVDADLKQKLKTLLQGLSVEPLQESKRIS